MQGILAAQEGALDLVRIRMLLGALQAALDRSDLLPCLEDQLRAVRRRR